MKCLRALLLIACAYPALSSADLRLPAVFGDHMVLQRDRAIPVWGWAAPGETVRVTLGDRREESTADTEGAWRVENEGVAPDIEVELEPDAVNRGVDTQLDRAIEEVLQQLQDYTPIKQPAPSLPTRLGE